MSRTPSFTTLSFCSLVLLGSCAVPKKRSPEDIVRLSESYSKSQTATSNEIGASSVLSGKSDRWWESFNSKELNSLIQIALQENPSIRQTQSRLLQASAVAKRELAPLLPSLRGRGEYRVREGAGAAENGNLVLGSASYELDLWGKNYASYVSSGLEAEASLEDVRTAAITLSASVVEQWIRLLAAKEEEAVIREQIKLNETILDLQIKRYENGAASALSLFQQEEVLAASKSSLPDIEVTRELAAQQLLFLLGRDSSGAFDLKESRLPSPIPQIEVGLPSDLLIARPDIAAGWRRLRAADWAAGVAWANRLPNFQISMDYTSVAGTISKLFETWLVNIIGGISLPVIDSGSLRAEEFRAKALADERFERYRELILVAVTEVESGLSQVHFQREKVGAVENELKAAKNTLAQAQTSYLNGDSTYLNVLLSLLSVQPLQQKLVRERRDLLLAQVNLYKALGGRSLDDDIFTAKDAAKTKEAGTESAEN